MKYTTEIFQQIMLEAHGEKRPHLDFSESVYRDGKTVIHGWCSKHGMSFVFKVGQYMNGRICHRCGRSAGEGLLRLIILRMQQEKLDVLAKEKAERTGKWKNEAFMQKTLKELFPNNEVITEASPKFIFRKRLDAYIPELKLAFEYQGKQHYEEIPHFHRTKEAFKNAVNRDKAKKRECKKEGVKIIYFTYRNSLTHEFISNRITKETGIIF